MGCFSNACTYKKKEKITCQHAQWHENVKLRYKDFDFCLLARSQMILHKTSDRCHFEEQGYSVKCIITIDFQSHRIIMNRYSLSFLIKRDATRCEGEKKWSRNVQWQSARDGESVLQYLRFSYVYSNDGTNAFLLPFIFCVNFILVNKIINT